MKFNLQNVKMFTTVKEKHLFIKRRFKKKLSDEKGNRNE